MGWTSHAKRGPKHSTWAGMPHRTQGLRVRRRTRAAGAATVALVSTTGTDTAGAMGTTATAAPVAETGTGTGTTAFMETRGILVLVEVGATAATQITTTMQIMVAGAVEAARASA